MPIYRAAAHANLAAQHWRAGQVEAAQTEAERAMALWGDYPYPFRWLACWVLLAVHTACEELTEAAAQVQAILHPSQRRQPGELPETLAAAAAAWQAGEPAAARAALQRSLELARAVGYL